MEITRQGEGSHIILEHDKKEGKISFPIHGSKEVGKGLEKSIRKMAGI